MKTRNGIYYDLTKSTYNYVDKETKLIYSFSSDLHLCKFEERKSRHRKEFNLKFGVRFKVDINFKTLPDLILYRRLETRGFLILDERGQPICQENLILGGEKVMLKD